MGATNRRERFVCTECKKTVVGSPGDDARYGCDHCGGQLKRAPYGARKRRRP